jgi:lipid II:glycine glycyltransferase (peptidoglycan interpeptide bridge formation enzyme)
MRFATDVEVEKWDELIIANPDGGNTLQCAAFAAVKQAVGWKPRYVIHETDKADIAVLYLEKSIMGLGRLWYAPKGPGAANVNQLQAVTRDLKSNAKGVFAVKVEPDLLRGEDVSSLGLVKVRNIQYNWATVLVDLAPTEEEIINSFRQKTRYNIRLAERKGVVVEAVESTDENLATMYELMAITAKRAGVFLRDRTYFYDFWRGHAQAGCGQLFFARYEGQVVAGAFITYLGTKALYKDGGSGREHANVQAPYALQWGIMQWLKEYGVTEYDLHGTPPADKIDDPTHPLHGLARFKTGFNDQVTEYIGTYDLPLTNRYSAWTKFGERLVAGYAHRIKKELFY